MKKIRQAGFCFALAVLAVVAIRSTASQAQQPNQAPAQGDAGKTYTGMYTFLKDGEYVQLNVEDGGHVTGFISRYGDGESDRGEFLDLFFKTAKLEGSQLSFTTVIVHGVAFDFKGTVERGEGKTPAEEGYFVLKGTLTENASDANKKVTSHAREVLFKKFPQNLGR